MLLDNRTLLLSLVLVCAMMAISLGVVSWGREHDSLKKWAGAMLLETVAWQLLALRGAIPDFFSIVVTGTLLIAAQSLKLAAIHEYRGVNWPRLQCLLPVGFAFLLQMILPYSDLRDRIIFGSLIYGAQMVIILNVLYRDEESRTGRAWWLLFSSALAMVPMLALRAGVAFFNIYAFALPQSGFAPNPAQMAMFVNMIALSLMGSMGFILMVKEQADRAVRALAMRDSLTGLYNRRALMERAEKEYSLARRNQTSLALLMLDIDHFKFINDEYGHPTGDDVLAIVAHILESRLRKEDTLGRYGGEEFCILLPATDEAGARSVAEVLRGVLEGTPMATRRHEIFITISIGVAVCAATYCGENLQQLFDDADAALYQAKHEGRNRVIVLPAGSQKDGAPASAMA